MLPVLLALLPALAIQAVARPHRTQHRFGALTDGDEDDGCPTGVHIVGIRGTIEEPGFGAMTKIVEQLVKDIPGSDSYAIAYPAAGITIVEGEPRYEPFKYILSVQEGRSKLSSELIDFNLFCPNSSIVVMGYSQGAHVAGDVLCGSTYPLFPQWDAIEAEYAANIKAVVTLGDPRNNKDTPKHVGNSTENGIFERTVFENCPPNIVPAWQTYCDSNDTFCNSGNDTNNHLHYHENYADNIISFIKGKLAKPKPKSVFDLDAAWKIGEL